MVAVLPLLLAGPAAQAEHQPGACDTFTSDTGNTLDTCSAWKSHYVPDVSATDQQSLRIAKRIHTQSVRYLAEYDTRAKLRAEGWRPPYQGAMHWKLPQHRWNTAADGVDLPPRWIMVVDGKPRGAVYSAGLKNWEPQDFPYLGAIPRAHQHEHGDGNKMLHVWASPSLKQAFRTRWRDINHEVDQTRLPDNVSNAPYGCDGKLNLR